VLLLSDIYLVFNFDQTYAGKGRVIYRFGCVAMIRPYSCGTNIIQNKKKKKMEYRNVKASMLYMVSFVTAIER
jgi:hypothetical protein